MDTVADPLPLSHFLTAPFLLRTILIEEIG